MIRHTEIIAHLKRLDRQNSLDEDNCSVYAASINDINKILAPKKQFTKEEIIAKLPEKLRNYTKAFKPDKDDWSDLTLHRHGRDLAIEIEKDEQGRTKDLPIGPLYGMPRDELLCLRKEITELLDRNWIRASSSPGGAPVLFVKKPGGGLRFCVDYRSLKQLQKRKTILCHLSRKHSQQFLKHVGLRKLMSVQLFIGSVSSKVMNENQPSKRVLENLNGW